MNLEKLEYTFAGYDIEQRKLLCYQRETRFGSRFSLAETHENFKVAVKLVGQ